MSQQQTAGVIFPILLSSGRHILTEGADLIKASIKIVLAWPLRTRYFNGEFGSRIEEAIENQNDDVLMTIMRRFVIDSIEKWEKRIELISIEMSRPESHKLSVNLVYKIKELDIQDTLFYEFYIN